MEKKMLKNITNVTVIGIGNLGKQITE